MSKVEKEVELTEGDKIWAEIKGLPLAMYALPNQTVEQYLIKVESNYPDLLVKIAASAVVPAMETLLQGRYTMEQLEGYWLIKRALPKLEVKQTGKKSKR